jgi:hypothetical protein
MFARLRRLIRRISIFGVEVEFHPPPPDPAPGPNGPAAAPPPVTSSAPAASPDRLPAVTSTPGRVTVRGTAPNRRTPRELSLTSEGPELHLSMHPPGKDGTYQITLRTEEFQRALDAGSGAFTQPGTTRRLDLLSHDADPVDIEPGMVRIQLGTTSNQWWMYCTAPELRDGFRAVGIRLPN